MLDFKTAREANRARSLRFNRLERQQNKHASSSLSPSSNGLSKADFFPNGSKSHQKRVYEVEQAVDLAQDDLTEVAAISSELNFGTVNKAREVSLMDLPRTAHKKTLSSTFEIIPRPRVIALEEEKVLKEPTFDFGVVKGKDSSSSEEDADDSEWDKLQELSEEDIQPARTLVAKSYAAVIRGVD